MILVPFWRASASQWPSGILVEIQFIPKVTTRSECSGAKSSNSTVWWPVTIGWPGGRSVCHE
jgi:hypothetical protein